MLPITMATCGNGSDEPKPINPDKPSTDTKSTAGFDKYTASNIFSRNVRLSQNVPMQGFSLDSDGGIWYTQTSNTNIQEIYVSKGNPNNSATPVRATSDQMKLTYFGHGTNTAVEESGNDRYIWAGCYGSVGSDGKYWTERLVGRVKFKKGATVCTNECNDYYYIGDFTDIHPSIDAEHDQITFNYADPNNKDYRCFAVYKFSDVKNTPLTTVEITCTDGFKTNKPSSKNKTSVMVRAHDVTRLTPIATPKFRKNGYASTGKYYAWQGYDVNGNRLYYAEGQDNYSLTGDLFSGQSMAYITVFDMEGKVIEERTQIAAVADKDWTTSMNMSIYGTFESEGVKIKGDKIYLGFGGRGINMNDNNYYQSILVYPKPTK